LTGPDHFGSSGIAAQIVVLVAQSGSERCSSQVRALLEQGFKVLTAADGPEILTLLGSKALDCVVTDAALPQLNGIELLGRMHELDPDLPVVLVTDHPTVDCAAKAVEYGAFRYLGGSVTLEQLVEVVRLAAQVCRVSRLRRQAFVHVRHAELPTEGRASLEAHFERTLAGLWMGFQPVVHWPARRIVAYEALLRSEDGVHADPETLLDVAARLGRLPDVGRAIRSAVADTVRSTAEPFDFFVNLHSRDLLDANLFLSSEPLSTVAERVVLEITERASLEQISGLSDRRRRPGRRLCRSHLIRAASAGRGEARHGPGPRHPP
jgi:FixJ family two-component response regulator